MRLGHFGLGSALALWSWNEGELYMSDQQGDTPLKRTPLYDFHNKLDAKMVPFAGYEMPVQYPLGVLKEHLHVRAKAGLFDVSHMGQAFLIPADGDFKTAAHALETLGTW